MKKMIQHIAALLMVAVTATSLASSLPFESMKPEQAGFDPKRLKHLDGVLQEYIDSGRLPGISAGVIKNGKFVYAKNFGVSDLKNKTPMEFDTIVRIHSMTKPITSVAIMQLYEQRKLSLHDPVSKFIPQFKDLKVYNKDGNTKPKKEMTIHDLLTHQSGFIYGRFDKSPLKKMYLDVGAATMDDNDKPIKSNDDLIDKLSKLPLKHEPGAQFSYGFSTDVLGKVVEVISGQSLAEYFQENIFKPLGMHDTYFELPKDKMSRLARLYTYNSKLKVLEELTGDASKKNDPPVTFFSGGGGLVSTLNDYARFTQMLVNGGELNGVRILSPSTIRVMTQNAIDYPQRKDSLISIILPGNGFGLGFGVVVSEVDSGGLAPKGTYSWGGYANTFFLIDPQNKLAAIIMTQCQPSYKCFRRLRQDFSISIYQALVDTSAVRSD